MNDTDTVVYLNESVRAAKDFDTFGGPDKWHVQIRRPDGFWEDIQWMGRVNLERLFQKPVPRYKLFRGKVKLEEPVKT